MKYSKYIIKEDQILFNFYEFKFSSLRKNKILTLDRIKEVDFNTYPCSMEIDKGEIIFFNHEDESSIRKFTDQHNISHSNKKDVWKLLCNEFLDTQIDDIEVKKNEQTLRKLGISKTEQKQIHKQISFSMFGTLEWVYLGHWDLLAMKQNRSLLYPLNGSNFYWWTMDIALRDKK